MPRRPDPDLAPTRRRLANQRIAPAPASSPADLVRWLGAVQAQDYRSSLWAIGLRLPDAREADVEAAIEAGTIVRTWPMRGTLHFVPAEDVRWMLHLLTPRVVKGSAGRCRQLGLEEADFARARRILSRALDGGRRLTRAECYAALERGGVAPTGQRGIHVLGHLAQRGLLCCGPRRERQPTFVLLDEWVPPVLDPPRDEALATLATRYFASHGPATLRDFAWWSGLRAPEARRAVEAAGSALHEQRGAESTWTAATAPAPPSAARRGPAAVLLPAWDEYLVAYRDRTVAVRDLSDTAHAGVGLIGKPLVLVDGIVRGAWTRSLTAATAELTLDLWTPLTVAQRRAVQAAARRYGRFVGGEVAIAGLAPSA